MPMAIFAALRADDAAAEDGHAAAARAGDAAEEHALAAAPLLQRGGAGLHGHAARDLAHRAQQRERAVGELDGLVGDRAHLLLDELAGEHGLRREVQVRVDHQARAEVLELRGQRLLHLHDHVGAVPHLARGLRDGGPGLGERFIPQARSLARPGLDQDGVALGDELTNPRGRHADAVLAGLDLLRNSNDHAEPSVPRAAVSLGVAGGLVMMLALLASLGCADRGEADDAGPAPAIDGGGLPDGFAGDGPSGTDTGPDPALAAREDDCFDFRDDDFDSVTDCADPGCGAETVCCALGSEAAGCCTPGAPSALDLGPCAPGDDARSCAVGVEAFGRAALTVTEGLSACGGPARSLVPGADDLVDSGLVLPGVLDPAVSRIVIDFTLGATPRVGLARAAIALVGVERPQARVLPLLAVVTSEGQLRVVIGEAEVFRAPMPADCLSGVSLQLVIEPSGAYSLTARGRPAPPRRDDRPAQPRSRGGVRTSRRSLARGLAGRRLGAP
jgi:hypothetical protein